MSPSATTKKRANRSVLDYPFTADLVKALEEALVISADDSTASDSITASESSDSSTRNDWVLPVFDPATCRPQSVETEAKRLQVLNSFMVLETENEPEFDAITAEAARVFNVSYALISLVDLGRQWFKSVASKAPPSCSETPRRYAFCNYTVQTKDDIFVVLNAKADARFCENPRVTGGPQIRFYAGAPLEAPEGVRLGTICLVDTKPRASFSESQQDRLREMAARVVQLLVDRRARLHSEQTERKQQRRVPNPLYSSRSSVSLSSSSLEEEDVKKSRTGRSPSSPAYLPRTQSSPSFTSSPTVDAPGASAPCNQAPQEAPTLQEEQQDARNDVVIPRPKVNMILPDYKTAGVEPDRYLAQLVQAMHGVKLQLKSALELQDFFPTITEDQMAAYSMQVVTATRENKVEELRAIVQEQGPDAVNCFNRFGESLLNLACRRGFKDIVAFFLSQEVGLNVRTRDDCGRTPLHDACWNPEPLLDICTWLMEKDPSLFLIQDKRGYTAFQYARTSDWHIWRKFLFDRRHLLERLATAEIVQTFSAQTSTASAVQPHRTIA